MNNLASLYKDRSRLDYSKPNLLVSGENKSFIEPIINIYNKDEVYDLEFVKTFIGENGFIETKLDFDVRPFIQNKEWKELVNKANIFTDNSIVSEINTNNSSKDWSFLYFVNNNKLEISIDGNNFVVMIGNQIYVDKKIKLSFIRLNHYIPIRIIAYKISNFNIKKEKCFSFKIERLKD